MEWIKNPYSCTNLMDWKERYGYQVQEVVRKNWKRMSDNGKPILAWEDLLTKQLASAREFEELIAKDVLLEFETEAKQVELFKELRRDEKIRDYVC